MVADGLISPFLVKQFSHSSQGCVDLPPWRLLGLLPEDAQQHKPPASTSETKHLIAKPTG